VAPEVDPFVPRTSRRMIGILMILAGTLAMLGGLVGWLIS
jgi:hypothetical protein